MAKPGSQLAVAYLRRSTGKQEESLESQLDWAIQKAKELDCDFDADQSLLRCMRRDNVAHRRGLFIDDSVSGSVKKRPGLDALLHTLANQSDASVLLCYAQDRLGRPRRAIDGAVLVDSILGLGVKLVTNTSVMERTTDSQHQMVSQLISWLESHNAGQYSYNLAESVLRGQKYNAERGIWNGGDPPYGFVRVLFNKADNSIDRTLETGEIVKKEGYGTAVLPGQDPDSIEKLDRVRWIHEFYACHGGVKAVIRELHRQGVPSPHAGRTRNGKPVSGMWSSGSITNILKSPHYMGQFTWGRTGQGSHARYAPDQPGSAIRMQEMEPVTINHNRDSWNLATPSLHYEPVISPDLWMANFEKLQQRGEKSAQQGVRKSTNPDRYPIGRVVCGDCGHPMMGEPIDVKDEFRYVCHTYKKSTAQPRPCHHNWVTRDQLVWFVLEGLRRLTCGANASNRDRLRTAVKNVLEEQRLSQPDELGVDALEAECNAVRSNIEKAMQLQIEATDSTTREAAANVAKGYQSQARKLTKRLRTAKRLVRTSKLDLDQEVDAALALVGHWRTLAERAPKRGLSRLLNAIGAEVTVDFEHRDQGRRKNIPVKAHLRFSPSPSAIALTKDVSTVPVGQREASEKGDRAVSTECVVISPGRSGKLTKGNRGDRT